MRKVNLALGILILLATSSLADSCQTWTWNNKPIKMETCVYSSGGSGYINFRNTSSRDIEICWTLDYADGRTSKGCRLNFGGYAEASSSEYHLSKSRLDGIRLTKFNYLN